MRATSCLDVPPTTAKRGGEKLTGYRFCQQSVENFSIAEIENEQNFNLKVDNVAVMNICCGNETTMFHEEKGMEESKK